MSIFIMPTIKTAPQYLVITAIGQNKTGLVSELTGLIYQSGCNVVDSKMAIFANEFSIIMLLEGEQNSLLQLETQLPQLSMELGLLTMMKRTQKRHIADDSVHYMIEISGPDKAGTIKLFTSFLAENGIDITSLKSDTQLVKGKMKQQASIEVQMPADTNVAEFESEFTKLCQSYEMDCTINPIKIEKLEDE